ncbi:striatin [Holotrichia oblita]|uniref:Striatin n=1 Tax=Holotrichia oblita TaxID=644536 RepID=A0ACB9T8E9_HOLOL|nr:striatin [Holotrichia oblita]
MYNNEEKRDMLSIFYSSNRNTTIASTRYLQMYPERQQPHRSIFLDLDRNLVAYGSFTKPHNVHANRNFNENRQNILQMINNNPSTSTREVASELNLSQSRVWRTLHQNRFKPYKIHVSHTLLPGDNLRRLEYCRRTPAKKTQPSSLAEAMMMETEAAVMVNLDFLTNADVDMEDDDDINEDVELEPGDEMDDDVKAVKRKGKLDDDVDAEAMEVLNELNLLSESVDHQRQDIKEESNEWNKGQLIVLLDGKPCRQLRINDEENIDSTLGLGELAQLTVNNDAETTYDISSSKEAFRKTWNAKYTLRSHFDGVRALAFHPTEPVLITASEDHTLKLWNLQKTVPAKKSASLDVEPLYTFRCHTGPVLCLAISGTGEYCYSGGLDRNIHCWHVPNSNIDPYDLFEPEVLNCTLSGHTDAVWGLSVLHSRQHLVSCAADGTVKLWAPHSEGALLNTFTSEADGIPSSVDFVNDEPNRIVAAFNSSHSIIFDTETGKPVVRLESGQDSVAANKQINRVVCHPTLPLTISAHEDRHIRFWDNNTGKIVHSMVAHLDAVTSLAVDPNGLYLLSGSHDCSIRLWHLDNKTCVQEITAPKEIR